MQYLLDLLFPPRADEKLVRGETSDTFLAHLAPRLIDETRPGTVELLPFHEPMVRATLHEAKYHGSRHAFTLLASALESYLRDRDEFKPTPTIILPVPLGKVRQAERGYNQVAEVLRLVLARPFPQLTLESSLLTRTRETPTQVSRSREERYDNLRGAFSATRALNPLYTYIVVDDVITTGATLQAAVDALRAAGAVEVIPVAFAH